MQKIPIDKAGPGMVLEKPVLRDNGLVLVAPGTELTPSLLHRLKSMDVEWITVQGHPVDMEGMGTKSYQERIQDLDHMFRQYDRDDWMMKVKEVAKRFFQRKAALEAAEGGSAGEDQEA